MDFNALPSKTSSDWTIEELRLVRRYASNIKKLSALLPHRTRAAIGARIKILGVGRPLKFWPEERSDLLRKLAEHLPDDQIARILGTSVYSVGTQRIRLGIKRRERPGLRHARLAVVEDIKQEAICRGLTLFGASKNHGHAPLKASATIKTVPWPSVSATAESLGGELYVEWDD